MTVYICICTVLGATLVVLTSNPVGMGAVPLFPSVNRPAFPVLSLDINAAWGATCRQTGEAPNTLVSLQEDIVRQLLEKLNALGLFFRQDYTPAQAKVCCSPSLTSHSSTLARAVSVLPISRF